MGWTGTEEPEVFGRYLFAVFGNRKDLTPHRPARIGRHKDGANTHTHMEHTVTGATAQGFMKQSLEISPSEDDSRREQRDPDAGGT